jgi:hypothetical protein
VTRAGDVDLVLVLTPNDSHAEIGLDALGHGKHVLCENAALVEWVIQYRLSDPLSFLFMVREPEQTLRDVSESVMREVVGDRTVDACNYPHLRPAAGAAIVMASIYIWTR